jgi:hypothetical protein
MSCFREKKANGNPIIPLIIGPEIRSRSLYLFVVGKLAGYQLVEGEWRVNLGSKSVAF